MRRTFWLAPVLALPVVAFLCLAPRSADGVEAPVRKASGLEKRELWTTSKVIGSPEPPPAYALVRTYPKVSFEDPLELTPVPGQKAWAIAERKGKIYTFAADPTTNDRKLLADIKHTVYGLVFHPDFAKNGYFYTSEVPNPGKEAPDGSRIMRYTADPATMTADTKTGKLILTWPNGGHNGGCLRFGPDGMLYLSTGDGSGIADSLETGQNLGTLLGKILRIDVNNPEEGKGYRIPADNPFATSKDARGEVWAYGIRQAWKVSFDRATGDLWAGEVGQDLWEMVYRIEKGGNYGWSVTEGAHPFRPERKKGPTPILKPILEHSHTEARSITGGYVYHGERLPDLKGAYIYGDFDTGRVWMLRYDPATKNVKETAELAKSRVRIVAWAQDPAGEVLALDFVSGGLFQLEKLPPSTVNTAAFPRKLSETGLYASTAKNQPAVGLIPYSVNSELWSDGAIKERFLAIPGEAKIEYETVTYPQPAPGSRPGWRFPDGTVIVKTFALETEPGKTRRLETRLLVASRYGGTEEYGDQVWNGYTYIWNDEQTDAELADSKGVDRDFTVKTAGGQRTQKWRFPSRTECNLCHTVTAKYALGVNTAQMNRDHNYNGVIANQLATLAHIGVLDRKLPAAPEKLEKLVDYKDEKADLDSRARAYLHANCSHCHRKWGGGNAEFQLLSTLKLDELGVVNTKPGQGTFDLNDPRILVPGEPERSLLYTRMKRTGLGRMPHIASNLVDEPHTKLIHDWIAAMKK